MRLVHGQRLQHRPTTPLAPRSRACCSQPKPHLAAGDPRRARHQSAARRRRRRHGQRRHRGSGGVQLRSRCELLWPPAPRRRLQPKQRGGHYRGGACLQPLRARTTTDAYTRLCIQRQIRWISSTLPTICRCGVAAKAVVHGDGGAAAPSRARKSKRAAGALQVRHDFSPAPSSCPSLPVQRWW